jgi:hypothetical protein
MRKKSVNAKENAISSMQSITGGESMFMSYILNFWKQRNQV